MSVDKPSGSLASRKASAQVRVQPSHNFVNGGLGEAQLREVEHPQRTSYAIVQLGPVTVTVDLHVVSVLVEMGQAQCDGFQIFRGRLSSTQRQSS